MIHRTTKKVVTSVMRTMRKTSELRVQTVCTAVMEIGASKEDDTAGLDVLLTEKILDEAI